MQRSPGDALSGAERLIDLSETHLLDTPAEEAFDRVARVASRFLDAAGLGLALSKGLVEAMGGSIGVDSVPDRGRRSWVELPLVGGPLQALERNEMQTSPPREAASDITRKILYIEDNLSNLHLVERMSARQPGLRIIPAMQGRLGLELAREHRPDLILLDVHLPDITGDEILAELRRDPALCGIPVVVVRADATPAQIKRVIGGGAGDYLTKPLEVRRLVAVVDHALGREVEL